VPGPSHLEAETAIAKLKTYTSPGSDQTLLSAINKLTTSIWNKEELLEQWNVSIIALIHKKGDKTDCSNFHGITQLSTSYKFYQISSSQG
jgi:hypothetical protein